MAALDRPIRRTPVDLSGELPHALSLVAVVPEETLVISAIKQSEDGEWLIVRLFNPLERLFEGKLQFAFPIEAANMTNLREEPERSLPMTDTNTVRLVLGPKRLQTVALKLESRRASG